MTESDSSQPDPDPGSNSTPSSSSSSSFSVYDSNEYRSLAYANMQLQNELEAANKKLVALQQNSEFVSQASRLDQQKYRYQMLQDAIEATKTAEKRGAGPEEMLLYEQAEWEQRRVIQTMGTDCLICGTGLSGTMGGPPRISAAVKKDIRAKKIEEQRIEQQKHREEVRRREALEDEARSIEIKKAKNAAFAEEFLKIFDIAPHHEEPMDLFAMFCTFNVATHGRHRTDQRSFTKLAKAMPGVRSHGPKAVTGVALLRDLQNPSGGIFG